MLRSLLKLLTVKFDHFAETYRKEGNINLKNNDGNTLLHIMAEYFPASSSIIELIILGGDIHATNNRGITPFSLTSPELYPAIAAIEKMHIKALNAEPSGKAELTKNINRL